MRTDMVCVVLYACASLAVAAPRLALLAEDTTPETANCVDLLTAALAQDGKLDLVERTELRRVMDEQKLSAAGLVSPEQALALGRIVRAEGIVFLSRDAAGKTLTVRLAETRQGLIAGFWRYRLGAAPIEKTVSQLAADIRAHVAKLGTTADKALLISILRVGNATLDGSFLWIEEEEPLLLGSLLTRDPRVLLLERRQLGQLLDETKTSTGDAAAFRTAGILLDADIALKPGVAMDPDLLKRPVVMTVRLRTPQLKELASVSVEGTMGQTDQLTAAAATQILARLHVLKNLPAAGDAMAEAKVFLDLAARERTPNAADAAHALNPTDQAGLQELVESLMRRPIRAANGAALERDNALEWARNLARAAEIVRGRLDSGLGETFYLGVFHNCQLMQPAIFPAIRRLRQDPEIRDALRPVGRVARLVLERHLARWPDKIAPSEILRAAPTFVDSDLEAIAYLEPILLARLDAKGNRSAEWRSTAQSVFNPWVGSAGVGPLPPEWAKWTEFLDKAAHRPEPEVRFYAHASLALLDKDPGHVREMARLLPAFFEGSDEWQVSGKAGSLTYMSMEAVAPRWKDASVECLGPVMQRLLEKELAAGRLRTLQAYLSLLETVSWRPALIPAPAAAPLVEKGLALAQEIQAKAPTPPPTPEGKFQAEVNANFIDKARRLLARLQTELGKTPAAVAPPKNGVQVLWRSGTEDWITAFRNAGIVPDQTGCSPPLCLVDGGAIWGYITGREAPARALFQVDATTGHLRAIRLWELTREQLATAGKTYRESMLRTGPGLVDSDDEKYGGPWFMCRWRSDVCLVMWGMGVCLIPADAPGKGDIRTIGRRQGMPALDLVGIAPAGDTLYIASRQALVAATAGQDQVKLIVNLAGDTASSSLPRGRVIRALVTDRAGKNVYLLLFEPWKTPPAGYRGPMWAPWNRRCSVWGLDVGTGQWRLVRDELILNLGIRTLVNLLRDPVRTGPIPRLPVMPGTAEEAVDYFVRWADELRATRMATLADGSVIATDYNLDDKEFCIYRAPAPPPPKPAP